MSYSGDYFGDTMLHGVPEIDSYAELTEPVSYDKLINSESTHAKHNWHGSGSGKGA